MNVNSMISRQSFMGLLAVSSLGMTTTGHGQALAAAKISAFGDYAGYSELAYNGYERHSVYVRMRDGVRLAVDYFIPTRNGRPTAEKLPVVFAMTPYRRAFLRDGQTFNALSVVPGYVNPNLELSRRGYVIAAVDVRGQGASFGGYHMTASAEEARDGYDLVAWFAAQPWSSGKVGMLGASYLGFTQYLTASTRPPALKAIFPCVAILDAFENNVPGGVLKAGGAKYFDRLNHLGARRTVTGQPGPAKDNGVVLPVDGEDGPALLAEAQDEHRRLDRSNDLASQMYAALGPLKARDSVDWFTKPTDSGPQNPSAHLAQIQAAAIPAYHWGGWNDYGPDQTLRWYANYKGPQKLAIGPWTHGPKEVGPRGVEQERLIAIEAERWFDYWLKGVGNGVMDEAPIHYAIMTGGHYSDKDAAGGYVDGSWRWSASREWPVKGLKTETLFFASGRSGTVSSLNDGRLAPSRGPSGGDTLKVDPSVSTGEHGRTSNALGVGPVAYPDMRESDAKSLTYTTPPLPDDLVVVGTPVVTLYAKSTAADGALFGWLEEVDRDGSSTLVSFGSLRASHRTLGRAPYNNLGEPWPTSMSADILTVAPFNRGVVKLQFALAPTATRFVAGHRLRFTLSGSDAGNFESVAPDAYITVSRGRGHPSGLTLPVMKAHHPGVTKPLRRLAKLIYPGGFDVADMQAWRLKI